MRTSVHKHSHTNIAPNNINISSYEGIVPTPEMLEKYKRVDPRFSDMFYEGAKNYLSMRTENERLTSRAAANTVGKSMFYAFASVFSICGLGAYGFYLGYSTAVATIVTGSIVGLASAFVLRKGKNP